MVKAVVLLHSPSHRELRVDEVRVPQPGDGEVEVRHTAILSTALDLAFCTPAATPPSHDESFRSIIPGFSAVGVITELGSGVLSHHIGQRVAYCNFPMLPMERDDIEYTFTPQVSFVPASASPLGGYCEAQVVPADHLILLPDTVRDKDAVALLFPALVARMLVQDSIQSMLSTHEQPVVVVHPAVGFLGTLVCQWAAHAGAYVIRTSASQNDLPATQDACKHPIIYCDCPEFSNKVRSVLSGKRLLVVVDLLGENICQGLLDCLEPNGRYVMLAKAHEGNCFLEKERDKILGNKQLIRKYHEHYAVNLRELKQGASELFELIITGQLQSPPIKEYPLESASQAYEEVHGQDGKGDSFCILIPPIPNPKTMPDLS